MNQKIITVWTFQSDSNPEVEYQTLQYADGSTSCACKGWTRRVAPDGSRSCKHTRWVDLGTADHHCTATHHYPSPERSENHESNHNHHHSQQPQPLNPHAKHQVKTLPQLGRRKFAL